jgi:hypothetical protein
MSEKTDEYKSLASNLLSNPSIFEKMTTLTKENNNFPEKSKKASGLRSNATRSNKGIMGRSPLGVETFKRNEQNEIQKTAHRLRRAGVAPEQIIKFLKSKVFRNISVLVDEDADANINEDDNDADANINENDDAKSFKLNFTFRKSKSIQFILSGKLELMTISDFLKSRKFILKSPPSVPPLYGRDVRFFFISFKLLDQGIEKEYVSEIYNFQNNNFREISFDLLKSFAILTGISVVHFNINVITDITLDNSYYYALLYDYSALYNDVTYSEGSDVTYSRNEDSNNGQMKSTLLNNNTDKLNSQVYVITDFADATNISSNRTEPIGILFERMLSDYESVGRASGKGGKKYRKTSKTKRKKQRSKHRSQKKSNRSLKNRQ